MNTIDMILLAILAIALLFVLIVALLRCPIRRLGEKEKQNIKENGVLHFTKTEYLESIYATGLRGAKSNMGLDGLLGNLVWLHLNEGEAATQRKLENLKKTGKAKKAPSEYTACICLTGISDEDIAKMRIRKSVIHSGVIGDGAIAYRGDMLNAAQIDTIFALPQTLTSLQDCKEVN